MSVSPPNILLFLPDQHRHDWTGANTSLPLRTPNLDALARRGTRFVNALSPSPLCAPARACLASGKRYENCCVPDNAHDYPLSQPTYYQRLRDQGYRVAGVGKFDLHKDTRDPRCLDWALDGSRLLAEWGFTEGIDNEGKFDGSTSYRVNGAPRGPYMHFLQRRGLADVYVREHAHAKESMGAYTSVLPDDAYCDNWLSENGLSILDGFPAEQPWHLVVNFTGPHNPMDVTAAMRRRWRDVPFPLPRHNDHPDRAGLLRNRQNYAAMIENIDRQVGRFVDAVASRGESERTLIVYTSDHGEMLGDHGRWGKSTWQQPSVGIPLILAGPGVASGQSRCEPVSLHDLTATFLEAAAAESLPKADSVDLGPALRGEPQSVRSIVTSALGDWKIVFDGHLKLIHEKDAPVRLFDLDADPLERVNLATAQPRAVQRLAAHLTG